MDRKHLVIIIAAAAIALAAGTIKAAEYDTAFAGQDLHLSGKSLIQNQLTTSDFTLVFSDGFSMSAASAKYTANSAVVFLQSQTSQFAGKVITNYQTTIYMAGKIDGGGGAEEFDIKNSEKIIRLLVSGRVFVTADDRKISNPKDLEIYKNAQRAIENLAKKDDAFYVNPKAEVPELGEILPEKRQKTVSKAGKSVSKRTPKDKPSKSAAEGKIVFQYPVHIAPTGDKPIEIESTPLDGNDVATVTNGIYLWQRRPEGLLEFSADSAVIFYSQSQEVDKPIKAVYLSGDVTITQENRRITADEIFYDFENERALAVNAEIRTFDENRGIPIYVRAKQLRQVAENTFTAEDVTVTTSEFYKPQVSIEAAQILVTDSSVIEREAEKTPDSAFDAQMVGVKFKYGDTTMLYLPRMRAGMLRPDIPIKKLRVGQDSIYGTSVETDWFLSRLLGLKEPTGVDSTFSLDYMGKRGIGVGVEIEYTREDYFGRTIGYIIEDHGEDRLGRLDTRKNIEPDNDLRGWFDFQHRHFLPFNWQATMGINYSSDESFLEQFFPNEYYDHERETYLHLKRLEDNWALSFLGKARINDFEDELEELPSVEYHLLGQSLFDDTATLYSDTQVSRLRQRIGDGHMITMDNEFFGFASHTSELDFPIKLNGLNLVPYISGTFGYDDRSGFRRSLVDGTATGPYGETDVWIGQAGIRADTQFWKVYPDIHSRLWDVNGVRHIIEPRILAAAFEESDSVVDQHDIFNLGLTQRWQTRRGSNENMRTVDWMRLDTDFVWVGNSEDESVGSPDRLLWNKPFVPLRVFSAPDIFNGDLTAPASFAPTALQRFENFGPRRSYFSTDYIWRISDTSAILSDLYVDTLDSTLEQFNIGYSRLVWPNLSYYVGSRYLRDVEVLDEKGSNTVTFAATYVIDPRYTLVFAQQFDFDYGANNRSDISLIRRYHRMYWAFTYSADASLDNQSIMFSLWPQGVPELAIGQRRYMTVARPTY
ncbi:MAG: hypothetical protein PHF37_06205 [Phycisphaerae bacterium]|nr:hypothetical protein [Phycisphaerae bacterium]